MKYAQISDIKQLIQPLEKGQHAISIFIPTHKVSIPDNLRADKIRFKNALRDVTAELEDFGHSREDIKQYIATIEKVAKDEDFWQYRDNGLAIYATKNKATYYDLSLEIDYAVYVNGKFIISPLLVSNNERYQFVGLDLNLKEPRLFIGSQTGMEQILQDSLPGDLEVALRIDEYQEQHQHSTSPGGTRDAHSHGHGGKNDKKDKDIERYMRLVDEAIRSSQISKGNLPLIIAGEKKHVTMFKELSKYKNIHKQTVEGNQEKKPINDLYKDYWSIVVEHIEQQETLFAQMLERAKHRDGMQKLVTGEHIRKAARKGQVATLAISLVRKTYDSVIRRFEQRFKIALPSSTKQLMNIENTARVVMNYGGEIKAMLHQDVSENSRYIQAIARSK